MLDFILENESSIRMSVFLGGFIMLVLWEWRRPKRNLCTDKLTRWANNFALVVCSTLLARLLIPTAAIGIAYLTETNNWGFANQLVANYWLKFAITFVLLDLSIYLQHLSFHELPLFWRFHRVHHSDMDCDITTGLRFHPAEILLSLCVKITAIVILGAPVLAVIAFEIMLNFMSMFTHANIQLNKKIEPVLRWFIVTPDMHRVHHSAQENETNSNFGFFIPWWDRIFGTYMSSPEAGHTNMTIGLHQFNEEKSQLFSDLLLMPFNHNVRGYSINTRDTSSADALKRINTDLKILVRKADIAKKEAEKANKAKSVFLANMSHELRTPLNAIIGYSEMLAEEATGEGYTKITPDLLKINHAGEHLLSLINEILDLSKIEAEKMELHLEDFVAESLIEDVVNTLRPLLETHNNKLTIQRDGELGQIRSDATKVWQILSNLISNASKFTEKGLISIRFMKESIEGHDCIKISVRDTGIGMTPEQLELIFEPFAQADSSTTRRYGGTGLGLAITQRFCEMLGGGISVTSEVNKGSLFTVWIKTHSDDNSSEKSSANNNKVELTREPLAIAFQRKNDKQVRAG